MNTMKVHQAHWKGLCSEGHYNDAFAELDYQLTELCGETPEQGFENFHLEFHATRKCGECGREIKWGPLEYMGVGTLETESDFGTPIPWWKRLWQWVVS